MPQTGEVNSIAFVSHEAHDSRCRSETRQWNVT